jgi:hypothetical protein
MEERFNELTSLVKKLSNRTGHDGACDAKTRDHDSAATPNAPVSDDGDSGLEQTSDPADHVVPSAPIVVLREMGRRCTGIEARPRAVGMADMLELGALSKAEADALIKM